MAEMRPVRLAVVGCGVISDIYLDNLRDRFSICKVAGCCDLNAAAARRMADKYGIPVLTMEQILADDTIEMVVNLTPPAAHYTVVRQALLGGKHVYTEKSLATTFAQARELHALAQERGLRLGVAPDTFLGAAGQTARFAVDAGLIGEVTGCVATLNRDGGWMAEKYPYTAKEGGGIGMDVGIYYVTMLLSLLGPVREVCGFWDVRGPERRHYSLARADAGESYTLESENLVSACMLLASGAQGTLHFNANCTQNEQPQVILYGTEGILYLPDPNGFGGDVRIALKGQREAITLPPTHGFADNSRGLGVADMAWAIRHGRPHRAAAGMAVHAVELLRGIEQSAKDRRYYAMKTAFERPMPMQRGYLDSSYSNADPENGLAIG